MAFGTNPCPLPINKVWLDHPDWQTVLIMNSQWRLKVFATRGKGLWCRQSKRQHTSYINDTVTVQIFAPQMAPLAKCHPGWPSSLAPLPSRRHCEHHSATITAHCTQHGTGRKVTTQSVKRCHQGLIIAVAAGWARQAGGL